MNQLASIHYNSHCCEYLLMARRAQGQHKRWQCGEELTRKAAQDMVQLGEYQIYLLFAER